MKTPIFCLVFFLLGLSTGSVITWHFIDANEPIQSGDSEKKINEHNDTYL